MKKFEDVYPLSPLQEGLLYETQAASERGVYVTQVSVGLRGELREAAFVDAWRTMVERHAVLRTSFAWEKLRQPVQAVARSVDLPLTRQNWRDVPADEREARLAAFLAADRERGFTLTRAPLMRLALLCLGEDEHRVIWSFHHLLLDGWSIRLIVGEVLRAYAALAAGAEPDLPAPRPFRDYIAWLRGRELESAETFWRRELAGFPAPTPVGLPATAHPEGTDGADAYRERQVVLSEGATERLVAFGRSRRLTLNTLLQVAWGLLLSRYSGERDVVFGNVVLGRPAELEGAESMVGLFVNTLPVRLRMTPGATVAEVVEEHQERQIEARRYEHSPLVEVQKWSEVPRGTPLFESMLAFESFPIQDLSEEEDGGGPLGPGGLAITSVETGDQPSIPLLARGYGGRRLRIQIRHRRDRFDDGAAERLLGHLTTLLESLPGAADRPVDELPMLTPAERERMLEVWNRSETFPVASLHERFAEQARRRPDAVAMSMGSARVSYGELDRRSERLAEHLRSLGVGTEERVALCCERSLEQVVAILAVLKAGAVYVPIDPAYPEERQAFVLDDCGARVVLQSGGAQAPGPASGRTVIDLDRRAPEAPGSDPSANALPASVDAGTLAYVIYTSGSTGRPKGVEVSHAAVARLFTATRSWFGFDAGDAWTLFHSYAFDFSVWEMWGALLHGGHLVVVPYWISRSPESFWETLERERVTMLSQTPSAFRSLVPVACRSRAGAAGPAPAESALRFVVFGGEALEPAALEPWWRTFGTDRPALINMYGITETTVHVTYRPVSPRDAETSASPIGRPIPDLRTHLVDREGRLVPVGVPGEIHVGGAGVARGYSGRPALTAERFVPDPRSPAAGARAYRSGDLARRSPDGGLEYLGRIDHQVKVRGFRIEPGEIESSLAGCPGVRAAVVTAQDHPESGKRLVAYYTGDPEPAELGRLLADRLPEHMVPALFTRLEALPLTPSGKVDRRALPAPETFAVVRDEELVAPRNETEKTLAEIWSQVLRVEEVGIHDDFFRLGGDSILSLQVVGRAREAGLEITPRQVFLHPTVAGLAEVAGTAAGTRREPETITGPVPLTPIQQWFFQLDPPRPWHWNQALLFEVLEPVDGALLRRAVELLTTHHDALRSRFVREEDGWRQRIEPPGGPEAFAAVDLGGLEPALRSAAQEAAAASVQGSLDLARGPLLRVVLFDHGGEAPARVLLVAHHLVVDAVSWRILLADLEGAYRRLREGRAPRLLDKTDSFQRWAQALERLAAAPELAEERDYWSGPAWRGSRPLEPDFPGGENVLALAETVTSALGADETEGLLREVPAAYRTTIDEALLTALALALARDAGDGAVAVNLEGHGRDDLDELDVSRTVGWFTKIHPVLLQADPGAGPGEVLKETKERLRAVPRGGLGYGLLRKDGAALPGADVAFNYLGQLDQALPPSSLFRRARESAGPSMSPDARIPHLLTVTAQVAGGRLRTEWTYSSGLFLRATVERLAAAFGDALRALVEHCRSPEAGGWTASDFPHAELTQDDLDDVLAELTGSVEVDR